MLSMRRIYAITKRYALIQSRDINRFFDISLWPMLDIMMLGYISVWITARNGGLSMPTAVGMIPVLGAFFWQLIQRTSQEFGLGLLEEFASRNLANMFSSPLMFVEWLCAVVLFSLARMMVVVILCALLLKTVFQVNLALLFGWWLVPLIGLFTISGWGVGLCTAAIVMTGGRKMSSFVWATWVCAPFCGAFNPLNVLPHWIQTVGKFLPMTYTFAALQEYVVTGTMPLQLLAKSCWANGLFLVGALALFAYRFHRSKDLGFTRLEVD